MVEILGKIMKKAKRKEKKITGVRLIFRWLQSSLDQALTIAVWVVIWSIVEPYICEISLPIKLLVVLLLLIILQRDGNIVRMRR